MVGVRVKTSKDSRAMVPVVTVATTWEASLIETTLGSGSMNLAFFDEVVVA